MPRDFRELGLGVESKEQTIDSMPALSTGHDINKDSKDSVEPEQKDEPPRLYTRPPVDRDAMNQKMLDLHPYSLTLNPVDIDAVCELEQAAFEPHERASREKIQYRLSTCGNLSFGLFTTARPSSGSPLGDYARSSASKPAESSDPSRRIVLLAHIIATLSSAPTVTDAAMKVPPNVDSKAHSKSSDEPLLGHDPQGTTICIHSLAVRPEYQGISLGKTLLRAYIQRMKNAEVYERIALIAREGISKGFYEKEFGFRNLGESKVEFGGGGWVDCVLDLKGDKLELSNS